jgi:hypothetical protein
MTVSQRVSYALDGNLASLLYAAKEREEIKAR